MPIAQLISPQALDQKKDRPGLVILDCRFALEDPDYGQRSYAEGHIVGASYADLERDLSGKVVKGVTGRHPLPEPAALIERLQAWGINADSDVVLYDDGPGAYAARAWWLLAWLGKRNGVFILDGGLKAWHAAGLPLSLDAPSTVRGTFTGSPDMSLLLSAEQLQKRLARPELTLLDARALRVSRVKWSRSTRLPVTFPAPNVQRLPTTWGVTGASCRRISSSSALRRIWVVAPRMIWWRTAVPV